MLADLGLLVTICCFIPVCCSTRESITVQRDYSYMKPNELLALHMEKVLNSMTALKVTVHPRIRHLYHLLKKDITYRGPRVYADRHHDTDHLLGASTLRPTYDPIKLNRIYTTEADRT